MSPRCPTSRLGCRAAAGEVGVGIIYITYVQVNLAIVECINLNNLFTIAKFPLQRGRVRYLSYTVHKQSVQYQGFHYLLVYIARLTILGYSGR